MAHHQLLGVNDFFQDSFFCTLPDVVHPANPGHLVLCFQLLVDAFCRGHSGNHKIHSLDTGGFRFHKVVVQFAGEDQLLIEPGAMFLQICLAPLMKAFARSSFTAIPFVQFVEIKF